MRPSAIRNILLPLLLLALCGCGGSQSGLNPKGIQAERISNLWWLNFWTLTSVYLAVSLFVVGAIIRGWKTRDQTAPPPVQEIPANKGLTRAVISATGLTVLVLLLLFLGDLFSGQAIHSLSSPDAVTIQITGHRWWWEARYEHANPTNNIDTANEIHIPVGRAIQLKLVSNDVIHSFWVPNLHGKKDLIPGHPTAMWLRADSPGTYNGQCAEFCGHQHAHMRFKVIAEEPAAYEKWIEAQRQSAASPSTEGQIRGQELFLRGSCVMCHTIRGTVANGRVGPNLTHFGSRKTFGAATLPGTPELLKRWILNPHDFKPGVVMPRQSLAEQEAEWLVEYLRSLK